MALPKGAKRLAACLLLLCSTAVQGAEPATFAPKFYAFQNGVDFGSAREEATTLNKLGFDGISQVNVTGDALAQKVAAFDEIGVQVLSIYLNVDEQAISADAVKALADRGALIELTVSRISPETVAAVRQTAEMAAKLHIRVALYPHHGFAIATMPQALDMVEKVNHPNLGVMFNLCHFLKSENVGDLENILEKASPHLFAVSTSGANLSGGQWSDFIKPLDRGDFPQARLFRALKKHGFKGPVGLQCYGVPGDKRQNLQNSIAAWRKILEAL